MYFTNTPSDKRLRNLLLEGTNCDIVGVTSGCFDILHPLHIQYLEKCSMLCDHLIVGIDSDSLLQKNKDKPAVMCENDRAYLVSSLLCTNMVFVMNSLGDLKDVLAQLVSKKHPSIIHLYKALDTYYNQPVLKMIDVETIIIPDIHPVSSTTELVRHIQNTYQKL